jgi:hypothetical protein
MSRKLTCSGDKFHVILHDFPHQPHLKTPRSESSSPAGTFALGKNTYRERGQLQALDFVAQPRSRHLMR